MTTPDLFRARLQHLIDPRHRGVDADNPGVEILHRGRWKSMTQQQRRWVRHRQAIEPTIGHLKADHRMDRCWLRGAVGDALHAVLYAAGYNLRWLLRAIVRCGIAAALLCLWAWWRQRVTGQVPSRQRRGNDGLRGSTWLRTDRVVGYV